MDTQQTKRKDKKPFKQTRALVQLAINSGWTQKEIADKCRVQQSIVSGWRNGTKHGTEQQLQPLLKEFGHKLRRNSFKVYWGVNKETGKNEYYRVEGNVIFSQSLHCCGRDKEGRQIKSVPLKRFIIHHYAEDKFLTVYQQRVWFNLQPPKNDLYRSVIQKIAHHESSVDDAVWKSTILDLMTTQELLVWVESFAEGSSSEPPASGDQINLPFLVRQALLQHGFAVPDVVEFIIPW